MNNPALSSMHGLQQRALSLGAANAFDYGMQFILPVVLVRFLPMEAFGGYRLLWLMVTTAMLLIPLSMPQSLYYFLPRSNPEERRLHVHHTLIYLAAAGVIGGLLCSPWNPLLPDSVSALATYGALIPALVVLFAVTFLLDVLPTIDERVHWQSGIIIALSLLRTVTLAIGAWQSGSLEVLIWLLLALLLFKLALLLAYMRRAHGLQGPWFNWPILVGQFRHAAPLGLSAALYGLRIQADQWVAASLFALSSFASFSIAAVLGPMVNLCRQSVNHVFLPTMSRLQANGDLSGMIGLNSSANVLVARLTYPLLAIAFVFAEEIITLIYTQAYVDAAPVMRIYAIGLLIFVVELSSIMLLMREGAFALRLNIATLAASVVLSWFAAQHFGLPGAALGSTLALYADRFATLRRISTATGTPLARLQDWATLGTLLLFATLAGAVAWSVINSLLAGSAPLLRLGVGTTLLCAVYGALLLLFEQLNQRRLVVSQPTSCPEEQS
jgi:O-antigen/teichoic acid export membrane protein